MATNTQQWLGTNGLGYHSGLPSYQYEYVVYPNSGLGELGPASCYSVLLKINFKSNQKFHRPFSPTGDDQVEAAQQRAGQDLEAVGRGQGRHARRRRVLPRHAPHERQARRTRPPDGPPRASGAALQARILSNSGSGGI